MYIYIALCNNIIVTSILDNILSYPGDVLRHPDHHPWLVPHPTAHSPGHHSGHLPPPAKHPQLMEDILRHFNPDFPRSPKRDFGTWYIG